nr:DUF2970 domain-containing protein [Shewanella jiangmenensis]
MLRVFSSTIAAFFGVQSDARRREDFSDSSPIPFIVMGLILAACLVAGLIFLVNLVLSSQGG